MLKKLLVLLVMSLFLFACGDKAPEPQTAVEESPQAGEYANAPAWVLDASLEGGLAALGIAEIGPAGMQFARNEAMANGRSELARMINVKVKDLTKNFTQQTGIGDETTVEKVSSQVTKQVTDQALQGSKAKSIWVSPKNNLHILMVIDSEMVKNYVKESVETSYKNDQALWQQFQAKKAHEELDKEIEKEFSNK